MKLHMMNLTCCPLEKTECAPGTFKVKTTLLVHQVELLYTRLNFCCQSDEHRKLLNKCTKVTLILQTIFRQYQCCTIIVHCAHIISIVQLLYVLDLDLWCVHSKWITIIVHNEHLKCILQLLYTGHIYYIFGFT